MSNDKLDILPFEALVKIEVNGHFYARMQNCLFALMQEKEGTPNELAIILKELESREPQNLWEEQVSILLSIIFEIDSEAAKQGVMVKKVISDLSPSQGASPES